MKDNFKGVWIPKEVWLLKELSLQEKVFLAEIDSLDNKDGCFASNNYFSEFFELSRTRCSEVIKSLKEKGLITIQLIRKEGNKNIDKRIIRVVEKPNTPSRETEDPSRETEGGWSGKFKGNNPSINNTFNNIYVEIIDYLNKKTNKRYSSNAKSNKDLIDSLLKEGRTIENFKHVIDVKCNDWLDDSKWGEYLRPSTLFKSSNFDNYINQEIKHPKKERDSRDIEIALQDWIMAGHDPADFNYGE